MWNTRENGETRQQGEGVVAVAVDKDKSSQYALKWAVENLFPRDNPLKLVHVVQRTASPPPNPGVAGNSDIITPQESDASTLEVLLPNRCFCTRRQVQFETVILHDPDVARALINYVSRGGVDTLILGTTSRNTLSRIFKNSDVPSIVLKWASEFCNVYIISKGKVSAMRPASRSAHAALHAVERSRTIHHSLNHHADPDLLHDELSVVDNDNSLVSSERQSTDSNCISFYENLGSGLTVGSSSDVLNLDDGEFEPFISSFKTVNLDTMKDLSSSEGPSFFLHSQDNMEVEIRGLKAKLKEAMDLYHEACREAQVSKQKALIELQDWNMNQEQRMKEIELENARCKAAVEATQRLAQQEVEKRVLKAEIKAMIEADEKQKVLDALRQSHTVIKYQSLFHIFIVVFLSFLYLSPFK